jgi:glucose dehydrogenase
MSTANPNSMHRSWYYWLTLLPLIIGASLALLRYAGWAAIYSAYYDRHSEAWRLKEAGPKADLYWWVLAALSATATIVATILIRPFKSETLPAGLRAVIRLALGVVLVAGSIVMVTYGVLAVGHYLK